MAQKGVQLDRESFSCSICLDLLRDPVTIPCGHSYCKTCIKTHWDEEIGWRDHSCPQCRKTFTQRPVLVKSTMLADLVEEVKTGLPERRERQKELRVSRQNIQQRIQDREKDVKLLQQEVEAINRSADKAVKDNEKIFTELIRIMEKRSSDLTHFSFLLGSDLLPRVRELQEKLQQEITELKRKDAELKKLLHSEDPTQFLQNYPSVAAPSESTSSINIRPYVKDATVAVSKVGDKLQELVKEDVSLAVKEVDRLLSASQPEPRTRAEFLKYSCELTVDPNTANMYLLTSDGSRKITFMTQQQSYPSHPDRFTVWSQVLSREGLTGRCYWEVQWQEAGLCVAVAYKDISRAGRSDECRFGFNDKSWALRCDRDSCEFLYKNKKAPVSGPLCSRVGVYLDHSAGVLCFYSVSDTMTLLHRVQTTFTQPLYAGLRLLNYSSGVAEFCKLT